MGVDNPLEGGASTGESRDLVESNSTIVLRIENPKYRPTPGQHVIVWMVGVILASLIPIIFLYIHGIDGKNAPAFLEMIARGELLIISLVITIGGIAELALVMSGIQSGRGFMVALLLLGGVLLIASEALWYADIMAKTFDGKSDLPKESIAYGSISLFVMSSICSSACVWFGAEAR